HLTHAALACYGSPFDEAVCAVIDSYGEEGSMAFFTYRNGALKPLFEAHGPLSLGFYYMKLTELCGFDWSGGEEWKGMGLASYGRMDGDILTWLRSSMRVEGLRVVPDYDRFFEYLDRLMSRKRPKDDAPETAAALAHTGLHFFAEPVY